MLLNQLLCGFVITITGLNELQFFESRFILIVLVKFFHGIQVPCFVQKIISVFISAR